MSHTVACNSILLLVPAVHLPPYAECAVHAYGVDVVARTLVMRFFALATHSHIKYIE